jgi:hypothetical protein
MGITDSQKQIGRWEEGGGRSCCGREVQYGGIHAECKKKRAGASSESKKKKKNKKKKLQV